MTKTGVTEMPPGKKPGKPAKHSEQLKRGIPKKSDKFAVMENLSPKQRELWKKERDYMTSQVKKKPAPSRKDIEQAFQEFTKNDLLEYAEKKDIPLNEYRNIQDLLKQIIDELERRGR